MQAYASAVLTDGRVVIVGGEYDGSGNFVVAKDGIAPCSSGRGDTVILCFLGDIRKRTARLIGAEDARGVDADGADDGGDGG